VEPLYDRPVVAKRSGPLFNAFSYPTKIDPELVALFIASHTGPGDLVLDVFGGSGSTGIAAKLCDKPTERMRALARELGLSVRWGARRAVLYELSPLGALLASVMCDPPDPAEFAAAATALVEKAAKSFGWAYAATAPDGAAGQLRHTIWSEVLTTPCCGRRVSLWDAAVSLDPVVLHDEFRCPGCASPVRVGECERAVVEERDPLTGAVTARRARVPARVYGRSGGRNWSRPPTQADTELLDEVARSPTPWVPTGEMYRGDLYRSGYHLGINRYHQLYTPRNLRAMAALWTEIEAAPDELRDALRLLVLSYNASHATLLTRVVVKRGQRDFVVTGAQSGVLYVSGLPVEKNVFEGVRRKIATFREAFGLTRGSASEVRVVCGSSTRLDLPDASVDYVFTDPPFGDYIPYAEVNQVNEAWLGRLTDRTEEVIVSPGQGKGVDEYAGLSMRVFAELARVLRPAGRVTVVFHSSKPAVWEALANAFDRNGFEVARTSLLEKSQVSFKQVVSAGGTRFDGMFMLRKSAGAAERRNGSTPALAEHLAALTDGVPAGLSPKRMYARYVVECVETGVPVAMTAPAFYAYLRDAGST